LPVYSTERPYVPFFLFFGGAAGRKDSADCNTMSVCAWKGSFLRAAEKQKEEKGYASLSINRQPRWGFQYPSHLSQRSTAQPIHRRSPTADDGAFVLSESAHRVCRTIDRPA
jgi:hypothetical protein